MTVTVLRYLDHEGFRGALRARQGADIEALRMALDRAGCREIEVVHVDTPSLPPSSSGPETHERLKQILARAEEC